MPLTAKKIFSSQRGTTLIVVLILILLASVMALFAVKVNLGEQRASGDDVKTRVMRETVEAALTQGAEYMHSLNSTQLDPFANTAAWTQCPTGTDKSFPCGAVPSTGVSGTKVDPATGTATTITPARRANMYYYTGSTSDTTNFDIDGNGSVDAMEARMLPLKQRLTKMTTAGNGFTVQYGVGVVLCALKMPGGVAQTAIECATNAAEESGTFAYTLVAVGSIPGEAAHITLTQTVGAYNLLNFPPGAPPLVASGMIDVTGTAQVVTNPNSGGPGVPISMWTRGSVDKTGTTNTCYYDEFVRNGQKNGNNGTPTLEPPLNSDPNAGPIVTQADQIMRCDTCSCTDQDSLSFSKSGNNKQLGMDILQCSTGPTTPCDGTQRADAGANFDIKPNEFPCDLFQFVFKTQSHRDADGDYFCEKQIVAYYKASDGNPDPSVPAAGAAMGADEKFLYQHAVKINPTTANAAKVKSTQLWAGCASLGTSDYGIYWDQTGSCTIKSNATAGSVLYPLLLVADGSLTVQGTFFGMVFVRATGSADLDPATGGNATLNMNSGAALYGAVVVQGRATKVNGNAAIIYSDKVLANIGKNAVPPAWGNVPGSWSDRFSY